MMTYEMIVTGALLYASFVWLSKSKVFHRQLRPICLSLKPFIYWTVILSLTYYRYVTSKEEPDSLKQVSLFINGHF